jgi:hypothetical protein
MLLHRLAYFFSVRTPRAAQGRFGEKERRKKKCEEKISAGSKKEI